MGADEPLAFSAALSEHDGNCDFVAAPDGLRAAELMKQKTKSSMMCGVNLRRLSKNSPFDASAGTQPIKAILRLARPHPTLEQG